MNVQEINASGNRISTFVLTAIVLTIVALGSWGLTDVLRRWRQTQSYMDIKQVFQNAYYSTIHCLKTPFWGWVNKFIGKVIPSWSM